MKGAHTAQDCLQATCRILVQTWEYCMNHYGVHLPGALLKPNMILAGEDCPEQLSREEVARMTVECLTSHNPTELGGVVFLSGGQSDEDATAHLNLMNEMDVGHPWELSYSYGRALQAAALKAWADEEEGGAEASQVAFAHRAKMNSLARSGDWNLSLE